jgi:hypothetical protein
MSWLPIREAAQGKTSMATWKRRVASGRWPTYIEHESGVRMVWVAKTPPELQADELVRLREAVERLGENGADSASSPGLDPGAISRAPTQSACTASRRKPFRPTETEIEHEALLECVLEHQAARDISLRQAEREIGLGGGFLSRAVAGGKRHPRSARSWGKIQAWIETQEQAREAA